MNTKLLQGHVTAVFDNIGVRGLRITCKMVGTSKVGYCLLRLSPREIVKIRDKLKLAYYDWEIIGRRGEEEIKRWDAQGGCRQVVDVEHRHMYNIYKSKRNAEELKLPNGLQLTYMLIYHHPQRGDGCVQASYADQ